MAAGPGTMRAKGRRACRARTAERERFGARLMPSIIEWVYLGSIEASVDVCSCGLNT
jgi:hypothetical protein